MVDKQTDESKHVGSHLMCLDGSGEEDYVGPDNPLPITDANLKTWNGRQHDATIKSCTGAETDLDDLTLASTDENGWFSVLLNFYRRPDTGAQISIATQMGYDSADSLVITAYVSFNGTDWDRGPSWTFNNFTVKCPQPLTMHTTKAMKYMKFTENGTNGRNIGYTTLYGTNPT